jgi:replicative DNA helicase
MIQLQVLNKVLQDKSLSLLNNNGITSEYFSDYGPEYEFIINHFKEYGNVPDDETVLEHFPGFELLNILETDQYLVDKIREEHLYDALVPILTQAAEDMQTDSSVAVSNILPKLENLIQKSKFVGGVDLTKGAYDRFNWAMDIADKAGDLLGVPTGFELLDDVLGGMLPGEELIVIVGRPGQGKSWTLDKMMVSAWQNEQSVLLYSGEMSEMQVGARIDTLLSNVNINSITKGVWTDRELERYEDHIEVMQESKTPLVVVTPMMIGGRNMTPALLDSMIQKYKPKVVGIDQLSLMNESIPSREQKRIQYANITMDLYKLSAKYSIPIVLNVQAGRAAKESANDTIQLEHIAESDAVGQNASRVITMQRDEANGILRLSVVKNRYGEDNKTIEYMWDVTTGTYTLIGFKNDDEDEDSSSSSPVTLKARNSSSRLQKQVSREGVEAF